MKNTLFFAALMGAASMFAAEAAKTPAEFKEDFSAKLWSHWNSPKVRAKYTLNKNEGAAAKGAAQITTTTAGSASYLRRFTVEPSAIYQIEVMVKSPAKDVESSLSVQDFGTAQKFVKTIGSNSAFVTAEWQKMSYFFKTGAKTETVQILFDISSKNPEGATILFDDFKMTKVDGINEYFDSFNGNSWGFWKTAKSKMKSSLDMKVGKKAPGSYRIDVLPGNTTNKFSGCSTKQVPVIPGKTYTLTVFAKTQGLDPNARISLSFQALDEKGKFLGLAIPSRSFKASECTDWKHIVVTRKILNTGRWAQCKNILVSFGVSRSQTPGTAWFDDFEFFVDEVDEE